MYHLEASEQTKKEILERILIINQKISEYKFMRKMSQSKLKSVVVEVELKDIITLIETLVCDMEKNYYCYNEITSTVISFLDKLYEEFNSSGYEQLNIRLKLQSYQLSLEYQRNIRIKEHSEYGKIEDLIKCRESIIKFFHCKWKLQDYILEELEELKNQLYEYESHMDDVKKLEDSKLKSIIFQNFFESYNKKIWNLLLINDVYTS